MKWNDFHPDWRKNAVYHAVMLDPFTAAVCTLPQIHNMVTELRLLAATRFWVGCSELGRIGFAFVCHIESRFTQARDHEVRKEIAY